MINSMDVLSFMIGQHETHELAFCSQSLIDAHFNESAYTSIKVLIQHGFVREDKSSLDRGLYVTDAGYHANATHHQISKIRELTKELSRRVEVYQAADQKYEAAMKSGQKYDRRTKVYKDYEKSRAEMWHVGNHIDRLKLQLANMILEHWEDLE